MKTIAVILTLCAFCPLAAAQTEPGAQLPGENTMYQPKNLRPPRTDRVANFVNGVIGGVAVYWSDVPQAFVIRGTPQVRATALELLKRYDVPETETRVELTVYLIRASSVAPSAGTPPISPVPPDLKSAIDEMKGTFNYEHYGLWDTIVLPIKTAGEVQGILPMGSSSAPSVYTVSYQTSGPPTESKTVNFANFQFAIKFAEIDSHIKSDLTVHEGQKLVLGKIRLLHANADLFLILTTKVY